MSDAIHGIIHGKTIELLDDPGMVDGQRVEVLLRPVVSLGSRIEAILRTAGSMAEDTEFDAVMGEVERDRKAARFREDVG
jgi:hypothetical protein